MTAHRGSRVAARRRGERRYLTATAAVTLLFFVTSALWAIISPPFSGPDEIPHYNSVNRLVALEGWPRPYEAEVRSDTWQAVAEAGAQDHLPTFRGEALPELPSAGERSDLHGPSNYETHGRDYMVQHPPGPYAFSAIVVGLAGGGDLRWDHASLLMRLISAAFLAAAVPFVIGTVRRIAGSPVAGLVAGTSLLTIPFLATVGGFVTNDTALIATSSAALYFSVLALKVPDSVRYALPLAGAALGVALLSKGLALLLIPVVGVLATAASWRLGRSLMRRLMWPALTMLIAFVIGGWWWLRNLVVLGVIQPSQYGTRTARDPSELDYDFGFFFVAFWRRFNRLFWGRGAREDVAYPTELVDVAGTVVLVAIVLVLVYSRHRLLLLAVLAYPFLIIATTLTNAHGIYTDLGIPDRGVQGRYVFAGIAAYAAVWGLGWQLLHDRSPRIAGWGAPATLLPAGIITAAGALWVAQRAHEESSLGGAARAATELAGVPVGVIVALSLGWLACAVVAVVLIRRVSRQPLTPAAG